MCSVVGADASGRRKGWRLRQEEEALVLREDNMIRFREEDLWVEDEK